MGSSISLPGGQWHSTRNDYTRQTHSVAYYCGWPQSAGVTMDNLMTGPPLLSVPDATDIAADGDHIHPYIFCGYSGDDGKYTAGTCGRTHYSETTKTYTF